MTKQEYNTSRGMASSLDFRPKSIKEDTQAYRDFYKQIQHELNAMGGGMRGLYRVRAQAYVDKIEASPSPIDLELSQNSLSYFMSKIKKCSQ